MPGPLGRKVTPYTTHLDRYPLTAATIPTTPRPMAIGISWYEAFDNPEQDSSGKWWIGRSGNLGRIRGGHCVCLKPKGAADWTSWWDFYDQGREGACVGFGCSRMMTQLNRRRYFARWLWDRSKERDAWSDTNPGDDDGTSVDAACQVLREGHIYWRNTERQRAADADWRLRSDLQPTLTEGISSYRWARTVDDVFATVGYGALDFVDVLNSWGRSFPHIVRMPASVVQRLISEDGEFAVVTDR